MLGCVLTAKMDTLMSLLLKGATKMYHFDFISVGIDVGADFSWVSILTPDHKPVVKPFKIIHDDINSLERAVLTIKKAEESNSMKARTFLESTGIYHFPLFYFLQKDPVLKEYYEKKKQTKPKMVAIGAIMHKLSIIIFAVLRDNQPFILQTPDEHRKAYKSNSSLAA